MRCGLLRSTAFGSVFTISDTLRSADGYDTIRGGAGHDTLAGGTGRDSLYGESGTDKINGARAGTRWGDMFFATLTDSLTDKLDDEWLDQI